MERRSLSAVREGRSSGFKVAGRRARRGWAGVLHAATVPRNGTAASWAPAAIRSVASRTSHERARRSLILAAEAAGWHEADIDSNPRSLRPGIDRRLAALGVSDGVSGTDGSRKPRRRSRALRLYPVVSVEQPAVGVPRERSAHSELWGELGAAHCVHGGGDSPGLLCEIETADVGGRLVHPGYAQRYARRRLADECDA